ncbi:MAG: nuclear transport factor 2 family protein [Alphaproteobacteria bacterium]|nr:nuclear transport factor 2 family protein [Alphaproteobacteria bacterium]MCB9929189.1 nuclear transport factor 2 family protein [Alphaproteobacteria bacterium]
MSAPNGVAAALLAANEAFYDAFDSGDIDAMAALWAASHPVACLHPGAAPIMGRDAVLASWRSILSASTRPAIQCLQPQALVFDEAGLVVCVEALATGRLMASNLFALERGAWRMVHHHSGPLNAPLPATPDEQRTS